MKIKTMLQHARVNAHAGTIKLHWYDLDLIKL